MAAARTSVEGEGLSFFPADLTVGSLEYNKIAATNAMIDFFAKRDPSCVDRYFAEPYYNHNVRAPDGLAPVRDLANKAVHWDGVHTVVRRAIAEGDLVLLHSLYSNLLNIKGQRVAFDIFLFRDGMIVEHWDCLQYAEAPDLSGWSHIEGSVDIVDRGKEDANRAVAEAFVDAVVLAGDLARAEEFVDAARLVTHSPPRPPGQNRQLGAFVDVEGAPKATYLARHITIAEGNFVFVQGEARIDEDQVLEVYDLFRLDRGKIVEHWDIHQPLAPKAQWANPNGPYGFASRA